MIPHPDTAFSLRLKTNEMIERERFAKLLSVIEDEIRSSGFAGKHAFLVIGGVRYGSVDVLLAIAGFASTAAGVALGIPSFLLDLKLLSRDEDDDPNHFATAIGEVMAFDGVIQADMKFENTIVSIHRDEVPFARMLQQSLSATEAASRLDLEPQLEENISDGLPSGVEDEDQDWVPTLEASDPPPREAFSSANGYISSLTMIGVFQAVEQRNGSSELHFFPRDELLAQYFVVTKNAYEDPPTEMVEYEVTGNISLDGSGLGSIEILSLRELEDDNLPLRS